MSNALYSPDLLINNKRQGSVQNEQQSMLTLPSGDYTFTLETDDRFAESQPLTIKLIAGSTYFLRVNTSLSIIDTPSYQPYQRRFTITTVAQQTATQQISECCIAVSVDIKRESTAEQKSDGFSVKKTQNPFSR